MTGYLKLGTAQYTYLWDYTLEEALQRIKTLGFRYIELMTTPPHFWPRSFTTAQRKALRHLMDQLDLELVATNPTFLDINLASPNPGIREESVQQIMDQITLAHDIGAQIVVVMVGKRHPLLAPPVEVVWEKFAKEGVIRCLEHAENKHVIFGLENGPSLFIEKAEQMLCIVDEVNSPSMKVVFDVANASMVEPVEPALHLLREHLVHIHLSDTDSHRWTHSPIGMGSIDFAPIARTIQDIGFPGVCMLETTYGEDPQWGIESSVEQLRPLGWQI